MDEVEDQFAGLIPFLKELAQKTEAIDVAENFEKANIEYWPGKFEVECGGSKKKNYLNAVLKATNNPSLVKLAAEVNSHLQKQYRISQIFPFSAHFTPGRICEKQDAPVADLVAQLPKKGVMPKEMGKILLDKLKLNSHDRKSKSFGLKRAPRSRSRSPKRS